MLFPLKPDAADLHPASIAVASVPVTQQHSRPQYEGLVDTTPGLITKGDFNSLCSAPVAGGSK